MAPAFAWDIAQPGLEYQFPRDHLVHPGFKTEWWYFTGHLEAENGRRFGFQVTFFRQGVNEKPAESHFAVRDLAFAHAAISDIEGKQFHFSQEVSRMNFGEAGFGGPERVAWIKNWNLVLTPNSSAGGWQFSAQPGGQSISLTAEPQKPPVIHGRDGISQKAAGEGHASYYYSQTRLKLAGQLVLDGKKIDVTGLGWFDHEWATNQLAADQVGWNWFGLHLDDGRDLMLYQMRRTDGSIDPASSGTLVSTGGEALHLTQQDFVLTPLQRTWTSPATKATYPLDWSVSILSAKLAFTTRAQLPDQEMNLAPVVYWEGATELQLGSQKTGTGYMELTGYGEALKALRGQ
ncbi:MAG: lipocalin-like domain-containing protein [Chthoniobacterales bacterium]